MWFWHLELSKDWIAEIRKLNLIAQKRLGRAKKRWDEMLMSESS